MEKRRILFSGEASWLSTGFSTFNREIMRRLHDTGKYILAEYGSWAQPGCPESKNLPWKFYGALPINESEKKIYESNPINQFGKYKIEAVLADFQPDIVIDVRDVWMTEHLIGPRFRANYKLVLTPTVDSAPQRAEWIHNVYMKSDVITTYSRYGKKVLESEGVSVKTITSPGIYLDSFKPLDKVQVRDEFQMSPSLFIFGTVMRNQRRKLFPDLFDAYRNLRDSCCPRSLVKKAKEKVRQKKTLFKHEEKALRIEHSVLYCHTSWPDEGWNIPEYLRRFQLQRHVIFTYKCEECKLVFADWFAPCNQKGYRVCRACGNQSAHMPNTHSGVSEEELVKIYNLFDVYVHPSICEGWGLPIMESKACGVPGLYQNYSAMEDHVENGGGLPIDVERFYHEAETASIRSLPSVEDMCVKMEKLATNSKLRLALGKDARKCAEKMHSWDVTAKKFENIFDEIEIYDRSKTWDLPPKIEFMTPESPPNDLGNQDFIVWLYINILRRMPDQKGFADWMASLEKGRSREEIEMFFREQIAASNRFEGIRWKNSLINRGLPVVEDVVETNSDVIPGVTI